MLKKVYFPFIHHSCYYAVLLYNNFLKPQLEDFDYWSMKKERELNEGVTSQSLKLQSIKPHN